MSRSYRIGRDSSDARRMFFDHKRAQFEARQTAAQTSPRVLARLQMDAEASPRITR